MRNAQGVGHTTDFLRFFLWFSCRSRLYLHRVQEFGQFDENV